MYMLETVKHTLLSTSERAMNVANRVLTLALSIDHTYKVHVLH